MKSNRALHEKVSGPKRVDALHKTTPAAHCGGALHQTAGKAMRAKALHEGKPIPVSEPVHKRMGKSKSAVF